MENLKWELYGRADHHIRSGIFNNTTIDVWDTVFSNVSDNVWKTVYYNVRNGVYYNIKGTL